MKKISSILLMKIYYIQNIDKIENKKNIIKDHN